MVKGLIAIAAGLAVCAGLGTGIGEKLLVETQKLKVKSVL